MGSLIIVRGACATGKSTRMTILIRDLMGKYPHHEWRINPEPKKGGEKGVLYDKPLFGYHFPDINVFIVARYMKKRDHYIGLDGYGGTQENLDRVLESMNDMNVIMEGFMGCMPRYRRRPYHILNNHEYPHPRFKDKVTKGLGFEKMLSIMFIYENLEDMQNRVLGRGGKLIDETCSSWRDNKGLIKFVPEERTEYPELTDRILSYSYLFDANINTIKNDVKEYLKIYDHE